MHVLNVHLENLGDFNCLVRYSHGGDFVPQPLGVYAWHPSWSVCS